MIGAGSGSARTLRGERNDNRSKTEGEECMSKLQPVAITDKYKEAAAEILYEAIDENPDTAIVVLFWKDRGQFKIKSSPTQDRLQLIGALTEALHKLVKDGYTS
jgi:hypothetical protein